MTACDREDVVKNSQKLSTNKLRDVFYGRPLDYVKGWSKRPNCVLQLNLSISDENISHIFILFFYFIHLNSKELFQRLRHFFNIK